MTASTSPKKSQKNIKKTIRTEKNAKKVVMTKKVKGLPLGWADFRNGDDPTVVQGPDSEVLPKRGKPAERSKSGELIFEDFPNFRPNQTPQEVMEAGAFGGTYWRTIKSGVLDGKTLKNAHKEFPFFSGIKEELLSSPAYFPEKNKYGVSCGGSLAMWESKGWISALDPYGWFQWYCRFYCGRRSTDDERQVARWNALAGPKGRFKNQLLNMILKKGGEYCDKSISPVIRQTLLHWGYEVTRRDLEVQIRKNL